MGLEQYETSWILNNSLGSSWNLLNSLGATSICQKGIHEQVPFSSNPTPPCLLDAYRGSSASPARSKSKAWDDPKKTSLPTPEETSRFQWLVGFCRESWNLVRKMSQILRVLKKVSGWTVLGQNWQPTHTNNMRALQWHNQGSSSKTVHFYIIFGQPCLRLLITAIVCIFFSMTALLPVGLCWSWHLGVSTFHFASVVSSDSCCNLQPRDWPIKEELLQNGHLI